LGLECSHSEAHTLFCASLMSREEACEED
jgi:hypothetical protein